MIHDINQQAQMIHDINQQAQMISSLSSKPNKIQVPVVFYDFDLFF